MNFEAIVKPSLYKALSCLVSEVLLLDLHLLWCEGLNVIISMNEESRATEGAGVVYIAVIRRYNVRGDSPLYSELVPIGVSTPNHKAPNNLAEMHFPPALDI